MSNKKQVKLLKGKLYLCEFLKPLGSKKVGKQYNLFAGTAKGLLPGGYIKVIEEVTEMNSLKDITDPRLKVKK